MVALPEQDNNGKTFDGKHSPKQTSDAWLRFCRNIMTIGGECSGCSNSDTEGCACLAFRRLQLKRLAREQADLLFPLVSEKARRWCWISAFSSIELFLRWSLRERRYQVTYAMEYQARVDGTFSPARRTYLHRIV